MGIAVSGDGNTIVVGAQHEGSNARGINGNQNDDSAYNAGAAYVFVRNGANWAQQAYLKASNTGSGDHFGNAVAISADGNTIAVAAYWESGGATGINGNQTDDSIPQAGAVYVFTRSGHDLDAAGLHQGLEHRHGRRRRRAGRRRSVRLLAGAERRRQHARRRARRAKTATPPASTATRRTTRRVRPAPCTCSRAPAPRGRSRRTSSRMPRRWRPAATSSATRSRSTPTATRWRSASTTKADRRGRSTARLT